MVCRARVGQAGWLVGMHVAHRNKIPADLAPGTGLDPYQEFLLIFFLAVGKTLKQFY